MAGTARVLFVSNGHGEDGIAAKIIDRMVRLGETAPLAMELAAWPMVGDGAVYRRRDIAIVGAPNTLPSEGFATLDAGLFWRDLRAGWLRTHWGQIAAARAMRGRFDLAVAVGDVVPIAAARLARVPFVFVGCAKSEHYGRGYGYTSLERRWLRGGCRVAFARDAATATALVRAGVNACYSGNPMMDDLEPSNREPGAMLGVAQGDLVVTCLPGSRRDAQANAAQLLRLIPTAIDGRRVHYVFAIPEQFDVEPVRRTVTEGGGARVTGVWREACSDSGSERTSLRLVSGDGRAVASFAHGVFADALHRADVVIGLAGTANEQAIGLGKPLITLASSGVQGASYVRMKMRYFGEAAVLVPSRGDALARTLVALVGDAPRRARMAVAGRALMGAPGASAAIAQTIVHELGRVRGNGLGIEPAP
jgi:uncharacterized protein (TIGR03492 family)